MGTNSVSIKGMFEEGIWKSVVRGVIWDMKCWLLKRGWVLLDELVGQKEAKEHTHGTLEKVETRR